MIEIFLFKVEYGDDKSDVNSDVNKFNDSSYSFLTSPFFFEGIRKDG